MRAFIFSILVFMGLPIIGISQSISVAPISFQAWGRVPDIGSVSIEYKGFGLHYFHAYKSHHLGEAVGRFITKEGGYSQSSVAISYIPVNIKNIFRFGGLYAFNKFPTDKSSRANFWLDIGYQLGPVRLAYVHISNGFGLFNTINPGVDRIRLSIDL